MTNCLDVLGHLFSNNPVGTKMTQFCGPLGLENCGAVVFICQLGEIVDPKNLSSFPLAEHVEHECRVFYEIAICTRFEW